MKFVYLAEKKCVLYHTEEQDNESLLATSETNAIGKKIASLFQMFQNYIIRFQCKIHLINKY